MHEQPAQWRRYYHAEGRALEFDMQYSLSDRIRYYWPDPVVESARQRLFSNLCEQPPPMPLLSQYLPTALSSLRSGAARDPKAWVVAHVMTVLDDYHHACYDRTSN
jgi:D-tagatose-1,6-bisphosphate aldolase subunit GatZ/KbaZ